MLHLADLNPNKNLLLRQNYGSKEYFSSLFISCRTETFELVPIQIKGDMTNDYTFFYLQVTAICRTPKPRRRTP